VNAAFMFLCYVDAEIGRRASFFVYVFIGVAVKKSAPNQLCDGSQLKSI